MRQVHRRLAGSIAVALLLCGAPRTSQAFSGGITSTVFGLTGCPLCHFGGTTPSVALSGPSVVVPGSTNEYTLTILSPVPAQDRGGLNVSALDGILSTGGASAANTQTLIGTGGRAEITHSAPKLADVWSTVTFSFEWTAPLSFTSVTLTGWGNAVNGNGSPFGDAAAVDTLDVYSSLVDTPTPTATPTPTPAGPCADRAPLHPFLVVDPVARRCQKAIAIAGSLYVKRDLKAVRKCLQRFHEGNIGGDPTVACVGNSSTPPTDPGTAAKIAHADADARALLQARCDDTTLAQLDACASTSAALGNCFIAEHRQRIVDVVAKAYGTLVPSTDRGVQECQRTLGGASAKFLSTFLRASQRCLNKRNADCATGDAAAQCIGSVSGNVSVFPTDVRTADKFFAAADTMRARILSRCTDAQLAALDACASDHLNIVPCLFCSYREGVFDLIGDEYGGAEGFADPGITLQSAVSAAAPGDTIQLDPGVYMEAVQITTDGLQLVGQKGCGGERAIVRNPGGSANGIFAANIDGLLFQGFQVEDFDENDIFVSSAQGVTFRDMVTTGPATPTGTEYGIFPILSNDVLVENSVVSGVRDAGIYVGQSTNIVVRNNEVYGNVAGIEIENSGNAEVYGNYAHDNTGGILIFKLPGLPVQLSNCHDIHDNTMQNNNMPNIGSGTVGLVPQGTGLLSLSNDDSLIRNNLITGNHSIGMAVTDQAVLNLVFVPPPFAVTSPDFVPEHVGVVLNVITGNGSSPDPVLGPIGGDVVYVTSGGAGNCQGGNTFATDFLGFFALQPLCTPPATLPPSCPVPPVL